MKDSIPFYFPGATYHTNKKELDALFEKYGIEWDADAKIWSGNECVITGTFNGYKRPASLSVSGTDDFIKDMKLFAESVGAEIKDAKVIDIKKVREKESEKKRIADKIKKKEKEEADRKAAKKLEEEKQAFESVLRVNIDKMRQAEMSDIGIRNWIFMKFNVDISERFGLEKKKIQQLEPDVIKADNDQRTFCGDDEEEDDKADVKSDVEAKPKKQSAKNRKPSVKKDDKPGEGFISYVCRVGNHKACGGNTCACECHKK